MADDPTSEQFQQSQLLYTIATQLNGATELQHALKLTLRYTVELMGLETGWIWLLHPATNSVFLAASHQLPRAFTHHPERLSGWCYCIEKYLENGLESAMNISEITCSRLKDLDEEAEGLRYHASVPLFDGDHKIGLLNILSKTTGQFTPEQLERLHLIGEMLSVTITRARLYERSREAGVLEERQRLGRQLHLTLQLTVEQLLTKLRRYESEDISTEPLQELKTISTKLQELTQQTIDDLSASRTIAKAETALQYPATPLSNRELEVLEQLKLGKTNKAIAAELFVSERTIKFHVSTILEKLEASNRTDAVRIAVKRGIINWS